jgi:hypothetical protein
LDAAARLLDELVVGTKGDVADWQDFLTIPGYRLLT